MKLDKLITSLSDLTPQRKLELLNSELKKEKTKKGKEQILLLIETAKIEQQTIEENLRKLQGVREQPKEEPQLEGIVQKEQVEETLNNEKKEILKIYGREDLKYIPSEKDYKEKSTGEFTQQREQRFKLDEAERLKEERKKYETGKV